MATVELNLGPACATEDTTIRVNGHDITSAVRSLQLNADVGNMHQITLDVVAMTVTGSAAEARLLLPDDTRAALLVLGWTPPATDLPPPGRTVRNWLADLWHDIIVYRVGRLSCRLLRRHNRSCRGRQNCSVDLLEGRGRLVNGPF